MKLTPNIGLMKCLWHVQFQVKRSKLLSCPLHGSVPIWLIYFILGTNIVHDVTMCLDPFPGQKMKGQDHTGHLKWRSLQSLEVFAVSTPWLRPYLAESLHMWHTYNTWGDNVSHTNFRIKYTHNPGGHNVLGIISRSKGQGHRDHFFVVSAPRLPPYLTKITSYIVQEH